MMIGDAIVLTFVVLALLAVGGCVLLAKLTGKFREPDDA